MLSLNANLKHLFKVAQKPKKIGIGLMSGTSLDGLDIALCRFTGSGLNTSMTQLEFTTIPYEQLFKNEIAEVFAKTTVNLQRLCLLNAYIGTFHGNLILSALTNWQIHPQDVDFIASHGQTVYHSPKRLHQQTGYPNATLQIGDGDHLAVKTGVLTISDFRQKHIAAGGEGAPLALYGDVILGSKLGEDRILLNIGGITNLTYLPAGGDSTQIVCTDIGPGNTLIDAACRQYFNLPFDEDSRIASSAAVNQPLLQALMSHFFFREAAPKTTGPELFNMSYLNAAQQRSGTVLIPPAELVSTLSAFTATIIADYIANTFPGNATIFISGGGAKNRFIVDTLKQRLSKATIADTSAIGIHPDAKEAILFALLGNEALCGEPLIIGSNPAMLMGKFSFAN